MINNTEKRRELVEKLNYFLINSVKNKVFPGGVVSISFFSGKIRENIFFPFGNINYSNKEKTDLSVFYDLASLTKPLATTLSILALLNNNTFTLDSKIEELLETDVPRDKKDITLASLLNHSSGLAAYKPFYKEFREEYSYKKRCSEVVEKIINEPLEYELGSKQVYSDLGFILLGIIVEKKVHMSLAEFAEKNIYEPLGIAKNIFFNWKRYSSKKKVYAPTEDCKWRKKIICGQVHDDNAFGLGGVCGHAGLFADIFGVSDLVNVLIDIIKGRKKTGCIKREELQNCVTRQSDKGSWGLGFDTPSLESSSGRFFSKNSFGHLGFTGTSFWADLEKDISIVLLTNRVHPDRENIKIKKFRPVFHDLIMSLLQERELLL